MRSLPHGAVLSWLSIGLMIAGTASAEPGGDAVPAPQAQPAAQAAPSDSGAEEAPGGSPDELTTEELEQLDPETRAFLEVMQSIDWLEGPAVGKLGAQGEVKVPEGFHFTGAAGTRKFLEANQNPTSGREMGMVGPTDLSWVIFMDYNPIGYVPDDERESLDAEAMLEAMREGNEQGNAERKRRGWNTISLSDWKVAPRYDERTNNLEWALLIIDDDTGSETLNHNIRLLGREGVMEVTVMLDEANYGEVMPEAHKTLAGFTFVDGKAYADYRQGDRIAEYGLAALVTGGALAVAAKTGLLAKLFKLLAKFGIFIAAGVAAVGAKIFGKRRQAEAEEA